ncbi:MAG: hypothetical protein DWQ02_24865 [Bacteroidetes bacterium]|nr:MAG: hypothetical protein DWQ02_24865 [Bacteroidota bacterium]
MKIFRRLRQKLVLKRDIRKYLLYAAGEIALIVIGILIALSLNNWQESNVKKKQEKNLYSDIVEELKIDLREVRGNGVYNQNHLTRYEKAVGIVLNDEDWKLVDTLAVIAFELTKFSDFKNEGSAYQKLTVSGKIDLISDNDILNSLQNLAILYNYINRLERNQEEFVYTLVPRLTEYIRINPLKVMQPEKLYDYTFHNDIEIIIMLCKEKQGLYEQAEADLNALIEKLSE